jgi:hypothetical protein
MVDLRKGIELSVERGTGDRASQDGPSQICPDASLFETLEAS